MLIIGKKSVYQAKALTSKLIEELGKQITYQQLCDLMNIFDVLSQTEKSALDTQYSRSDFPVIQKDSNYPQQWTKRISTQPQSNPYRPSKLK